MSPRPTAPLAICTAALALACTPKGEDTGGGVREADFDGAAPDWSLTDVNATSPTFEQVVSPSDLRGQVSVWYYGHAT